MSEHAFTEALAALTVVGTVTSQIHKDIAGISGLSSPLANLLKGPAQRLKEQVDAVHNLIEAQHHNDTHLSATIKSLQSRLEASTALAEERAALPLDKHGQPQGLTADEEMDRVRWEKQLSHAKDMQELIPAQHEKLGNSLNKVLKDSSDFRHTLIKDSLEGVGLLLLKTSYGYYNKVGHLMKQTGVSYFDSVRSSVASAQMLTGASTEKVVEMSGALLNYGRERTGNLTQELTLATKLSVGFGVSADNAAQLAVASSSAHVSMAQMADTIVKIKNDTALSADEATRYANAILQTQAAFSPGNPGGISKIVESLMSSEGAAKMLLGRTGDISKLFESIQSGTPAGMQSAAMLGVSGLNVSDEEGTNQMKAGLERWSTMLQGMSSDVYRNAVAQQLASQIGVPADFLLRYAEVRKSEEARKGTWAGSIDEAYTKQLQQMGLGWGQFVGSLSTFFKSGLMPIMDWLNQVGAFLQENVGKPLEFLSQFKAVSAVLVLAGLSVAAMLGKQATAAIGAAIGVGELNIQLRALVASINTMPGMRGMSGTGTHEEPGTPGSKPKSPGSKPEEPVKPFSRTSKVLGVGAVIAATTSVAGQITGDETIAKIGNYAFATVMTMEILSKVLPVGWKVISSAVQKVTAMLVARQTAAAAAEVLASGAGTVGMAAGTALALTIATGIAVVTAAAIGLKLSYDAYKTRQEMSNSYLKYLEDLKHPFHYNIPPRPVTITRPRGNDEDPLIPTTPSGRVNYAPTDPLTFNEDQSKNHEEAQKVREATHAILTKLYGVVVGGSNDGISISEPTLTPSY